MEKVSLRPSDAAEGGVMPTDQDLEIKEARFVIWDYQGKAPASLAAKLILLADDGSEYAQYYSAGDPKRFVPTPDGEGILPASDSAAKLSKSSNYVLLMQELVNCGFPENRLGDDITVIERTKAHWIAKPQPERIGLKREPGRREAMMLVPSQILKLPWEKKGKVTAKAAAKSMDSNYLDKAMAVIGKVLEEKGGECTRQDVAVAVFRDLAKDPDKNQVAKVIFSVEMQAVLAQAGYTLDGETISAA